MSADSRSGRPPKDGQTADAQIQLRTTLARKSAYVRAAKPRKLTEWIFEHLDKASGFRPGFSPTDTLLVRSQSGLAISQAADFEG